MGNAVNKTMERPNGIPKTERIWETRVTTGGKTYCITSKEDRLTYYLYRLDGDKAVKMGKDKSPGKLIESIEEET